MKKTLIILSLALSFGLINMAFAGGAKSSHPCYDVADCKSQTSRKDFSKCIKANKEAAGQNTACATFRSDKKAYLKNMGMTGVDDLFN